MQSGLAYLIFSLYFAHYIHKRRWERERERGRHLQGDRERKTTRRNKFQTFPERDMLTTNRVVSYIIRQKEFETFKEPDNGPL